jgi:hypothetical protein
MARSSVEDDMPETLRTRWRRRGAPATENIARSMQPIDTVRALARIRERTPGSDAERRAALWLTRRLTMTGRPARLQAAWVRPQWAPAHAIHAVLGIAGTVVSVSAPEVGLGLAAAATVSIVADLVGIPSPARRLTQRRATQNVISPPTPATAGGSQRIVKLVIVGEYDAGRGGLVFREPFRRTAASVQRVARGRAPGGLGWLALALLATTILAGLRANGASGNGIGAAQLVPTLVLLVSLAALIDLALSRPVPGASDPLGGAALAIALAEALDDDPPSHLGVELVLAGAGDGPAQGMAAYVRSRRRTHRPESTAVIAFGACGHGRPLWWQADGALIPQRLHPRLNELAAGVARAHPELQARPHRGHGTSAALRARRAGWPAIAISTGEGHAPWPPLARTPADVPRAIDPAALDAALAFAIALVRALDDDLADRAAEAAATA